MVQQDPIIAPDIASPASNIRQSVASHNATSVALCIGSSTRTSPANKKQAPSPSIAATKKASTEINCSMLASIKRRQEEVDLDVEDIIKMVESTYEIRFGIYTEHILLIINAVTNDLWLEGYYMVSQ